jgi:hypothetical protein
MEHSQIKSELEVLANMKNGSKKKVEIIGLESNSYTQVRVRDIERGKGWCEMTQRYIGHSYSYRNADADCKDGSKAYGWRKDKGINYGYGDEYVIHRKNLELIINQ